MYKFNIILKMRLHKHIESLGGNDEESHITDMIFIAPKNLIAISSRNGKIEVFT